MIHVYMVVVVVMVLAVVGMVILEFFMFTWWL
jgi:hypothetical protein